MNIVDIAKFPLTRVRNLILLIPFLSCYISFNVCSAEALTEQHRGANIFLTFCAGCHGFDGRASYEHAPSFSLGDRLIKNDRELLESVLNGLNGMPAWENKLPVQSLKDAIAYLRLMHKRQQQGLPPRQQAIPDTFYKFKPTGENREPAAN